MEQIHSLLLLCIGLGAMTITAALAVTFINVTGAQQVVNRPLPNLGSSQCAFVFEGNTLIDATTDGAELLDSVDMNTDDWSRILIALAPSIPDIRSQLMRLEDEGSIEVLSKTGEIALEAEKFGDVRTLSLSGPTTHLGTALEQMTTSAEEGELAALRRFSASTGLLFWEKNAEGVITWANPAYVDMVEQLQTSGQPAEWPLPELFTGIDDTTDGAMHRRTLPVEAAGEEAHFDITVTRIGPTTVFQAQPVDRLIRAERALNEFIQSLSQTFAHLPTGLAIFNRSRNLIVFNPALTDLSDLDPGFLSSRPSLSAFLDQLRDRQRMPEPKHYKTWRDKIATLEAEASNGTFQETWDLPGCNTLRVTGKPHPGGAIALLFEDISNEITHTRRYNARLETYQSVLDALDCAAAVFTHTGELALSNAAYQAEWTPLPGEGRGTSILEASKSWSARCRPSPIWSDARDFIAAEGERAEWEGDVRLNTGVTVQARFIPIVGRASLVIFDPQTTPHKHTAHQGQVIAV
ncbi:PAS-domain containing protein [Alphaproteobacteria bacterium KMM 3653]|uniref:PAS-domain containing protein n=1 Tax=Harenicola maris TaxID=2841044 RepID=A0AAP2G8A3_9RHOB|nr:PAS-domain containing protein [Harenicola maris]